MTTSDDAVRNPNPDRPGGDAAAASPPQSCPEDVANELIEFLDSAGHLLGGGRLTQDELTRRRERIERAAQQRLAAEVDTAPAHLPAPRHDQPATGPKDLKPIPAVKVVAAGADRRAAKRARVDTHRRAQMILASARQRASQIVAEADQQARRRVEQAEREATDIVASNVSRVCSPALAEAAPAATPSAGLRLPPAATGSWRRGTRLYPGPDTDLLLTVAVGAVGSLISAAIGRVSPGLPDYLSPLPFLRGSHRRVSSRPPNPGWQRLAGTADELADRVLLLQAADCCTRTRTPVIRLPRLAEHGGCLDAPAEVRWRSLRWAATLAAQQDVDIVPVLSTGRATGTWVASRPASRQTGRPVETGTGTGPTTPTDAGYCCPRCGSWVVNAAAHTDWHMQYEEGQAAPAAESTSGIYVPGSVDVALLEALSTGCP